MLLFVTVAAGVAVETMKLLYRPSVVAYCSFSIDHTLRVVCHHCSRWIYGMKVVCGFITSVGEVVVVKFVRCSFFRRLRELLLQI
jgi:hypothetical protein